MEIPFPLPLGDHASELRICAVFGLVGTLEQFCRDGHPVEPFSELMTQNSSPELIQKYTYKWRADMETIAIFKIDESTLKSIQFIHPTHVPVPGFYVTKQQLKRKVSQLEKEAIRQLKDKFDDFQTLHDFECSSFLNI